MDKIATLVIFLLTITPLSSFSQNCEVKEDRFKGVTSLKCNVDSIDVVEHPRDSISSARVVLEAMPEKSFMALVLVVTPEQTGIGDVKTAYALIDGNRHEFRITPIMGEEKTRFEGKNERPFIMLVKSETLLSIESAVSFELKIGEAVFDATSVSDEVSFALSKVRE